MDSGSCPHGVRPVTTPSPADYYPIYEELIGFVPPRIQERIRLGLEVHPDLLDQVERIRATAMYPRAFDTRTTQLMLFGILLAQMLPAAEFHAEAARRAGATREDLHAVAGLVFLFRGLPAFNLGAEIINKVFGQPVSAAAS
jgi:4-carboxymuconolactone decarboxylase